MSSEFPGKVEILPENYSNCDYTFKIIIIGDSGKFINNYKLKNNRFI